MNICNRVLIVNKGEIIADGHPEEISNDPLVKRFILEKILTDKSETKFKTKQKLSLKLTANLGNQIKLLFEWF